MNLECGDGGLHLHPRLLAQASRGELKLVAVLVDFPWSGSRHDTKSPCELQRSLGDWVEISGSSQPVSFENAVHRDILESIPTKKRVSLDSLEPHPELLQNTP